MEYKKSNTKSNTNPIQNRNNKKQIKLTISKH